MIAAPQPGPSSISSSLGWPVVKIVDTSLGYAAWPSTYRCVAQAAAPASSLHNSCGISVVCRVPPMLHQPIVAAASLPMRQQTRSTLCFFVSFASCLLSCHLDEGLLLPVQRASQMQNGPVDSSGGIACGSTAAAILAVSFILRCAADVLRVIPARGIELAAFDVYKRLLSPLNQHYSKGDDAGWLATGLAGGAAGESSLLAFVLALHQDLPSCWLALKCFVCFHVICDD